MDLTFATKAVRHLCESQSKARRFFGDQVAQQLKNRLADLEAAMNVTEIQAIQARALRIEPPSQLSLDLCDGYAIVFCAADNQASSFNATGVWKKVSRVKILKIEKHA